MLLFLTIAAFASELDDPKHLILAPMDVEDDDIVVPLWMISAKTPTFSLGLSAADLAKPAGEVDWKSAAIQKVPNGEAWEFDGPEGEFMFRAEKVSSARRVIFPAFSYRMCNARRIKLQFFLEGEMVYETPIITIRGRTHRPLGAGFDGPGSFTDVKVIARGGDSQICLPTFDLYDDPADEL